MRPSEALAKHRDEVLAIIARYPVTNPRVFGSVARGEDKEGSDIDIAIDPSGVLTYFDLAKLELELETLLGCSVDIGTARSLRPEARPSAERDFRAI